MCEVTAGWGGLEGRGEGGSHNSGSIRMVLKDTHEHKMKSMRILYRDRHCRDTGMAWPEQTADV